MSHPLRRFPQRHRRRLPQRAGGPSGPLAMALAILAAFLWTITPVPALSAAVPPLSRPPAQPGLPWLSVRDGRIVDAQDRTVLLRGFNTEALLDYSNAVPTPFDDSDAAMLEAEGFDSVRLPIAWSRLEPQRGHWDSAYLDLVDRTVAMLNRHHLHVILDMHLLDWGPRFGGSGAPLWATLPGIPDVHPWPSEPWGRHLSPSQNADYAYFWLSGDWQADYLLTWQRVASRFRDRSGVAGYDLLNEPHPLPILPGGFERQFLFPFYAHAISAIATVDPNHLFIVEGTLFGDLGTATVPLHARNLVYSGHIYTGSLIAPAFDGDPSALDHRLDGQIGEAARVGGPLWEGELGIDRAQAHATGWADAVLDHLDDLDAGWSWWQWRQDGGWGIRDRAGTVDTGFLAHVARPYLIAAPATVSAGHGDGVHGSLRVSVSAHVDTHLMVAWPAGIGQAPQVRSDCDQAQLGNGDSGRLVVVVHASQQCHVDITAG